LIVSSIFIYNQKSFQQVFSLLSTRRAAFGPPERLKGLPDYVGTAEYQ
jgi:hypothetical protein